jgi:hypothetical protein
MSMKKQLLTSYWLQFPVLMPHPGQMSGLCSTEFYKESNELNHLSFS